MALKKMDILLRSRMDNTRTMFVFDEPTGSLDNHLRDVFLSLLFERVRRHNLTILLITHDYSMVSEVTRAYPDLLDRIAFKEISLQQSGLMLREFAPSTYLKWLDEQQTSVRAAAPRGTNPLLRVESGAEVFGSRLTISKDPHGNEACPLEIFPGTLVYLKAPSGTGKTTIVKMLMGLVPGRQLKFELGGLIVTERTPRRFWQRRIWGKKMTMVFQHADEALNPRSTVEETFRGLPLKKAMTRDDIRQTLHQIFDIELSDEFLAKPVATLSGGQKQRINLMRGLVLETDILILDEPLNGLDFDSTTRVLAMLREKQRSGKGILLISHNEEIFDTLVSKECIYYLTAKPVNPD
jgi:ABC-type dipeptide/oligopeptide/nickel transport system ATPase subunit